MALSFFTDRDRPPTAEEMLSVVGTGRPLWEALTHFVEDSFGVRGSFKNYGKNYGWMLAFHKGGKTLISLYPREGAFVAQLILGSTQLESAFELSLGDNLSRAMSEGRQYPEGHWLFVSVETERDVRDLQQLLLVKAKPARKQRGSTT